ncbi:restriction endonuclease [Serratia marcescens]|uniref:restriction endonuclease n=1 Tax=Serratia TaxID=613 RepID=UPI0013D93524|nr:MULTISPECIES: restriction endonuclease [Serratia]ELQ9307534.1 restriction endonuclease [Serratia marcescens]ELQ9441239.1 restriction endonuclease [Serratia marcescens]ELT5558982.1 restriction endonuclease [Serratia marcescens]MBH2720521.1 restriction endonuclease [Serratia ureilytica]MBZ0049117.1 restriction endonuclease [Serratia sp. EWG9]
MGRRSGFEGFIRATARAVAAAERERKRSERNHFAEIRRLEREAKRENAQILRVHKAAEKAAKVAYLEGRLDEVSDLNAELEEVIIALSTLLEHTLEFDDSIDFSALKKTPQFEDFKTPGHLLPEAEPELKIVNSPPAWKNIFPWVKKKYQRELKSAEEIFARRKEEYLRRTSNQKAELNTLVEEYQKHRVAYFDELEKQHEEVNQFELDYLECVPDSVLAYCEMVLTRSEYPEVGFPQSFRLAYLPENKELVVEYSLPDISIVPNQLEYRYVKTRDAIESKARKANEIKEIYQNVIAAITLRTLHELFEADKASALTSVLFNGVIETIDPTSGHDVVVTLVSARAHKDDFMQIKLERVEKIACLRSLGAQVSGRPDELQAVKPILEFDMVDKRFIEQGDALSGLETRPNLMELSPSEFEVLVSNLFTQMGLDTKLTRGTKDGGVDAVAFDTRPILGGKVVIQAKRYKDTVGVSSVRDLYGTMMNEGANKGILVCTSQYGKDAYRFCEDKPIELIDGGGLLYLLKEHAGVSARINPNF